MDESFFFLTNIKRRNETRYILECCLSPSAEMLSLPPPLSRFVLRRISSRFYAVASSERFIFACSFGWLIVAKSSVYAVSWKEWPEESTKMDEELDRRYSARG